MTLRSPQKNALNNNNYCYYSVSTQEWESLSNTVIPIPGNEIPVI